MTHPPESEPTDLDRLPRGARSFARAVRTAGLPVRIREFDDTTHTAAQAAAALGCEIGAIASSLLFLADGAPVLAMTSGRHRADPRALAAAVGAEDASMASAKQVREITGQAIGGVAPVGHPQAIRTVVDASLADYPQVWTAAGTPRTVMPLTFDQLVELTGGTTARIGEDDT